MIPQPDREAATSLRIAMAQTYPMLSARKQRLFRLAIRRFYQAGCNCNMHPALRPGQLSFAAHHWACGINR